MRHKSPIPNYIMTYLSKDKSDDERTTNAIAKGVCLELDKDIELQKDRNNIVGRVHYHLYKMEKNKIVTHHRDANAVIWSLVPKHQPNPHIDNNPQHGQGKDDV